MYLALLDGPEELRLALLLLGQLRQVLFVRPRRRLLTTHPRESV
jgi:hypothetical protein